LPAWRLDSNGPPTLDPSSDDGGPFLLAVKAAYKAHKWVQDHAENFPVTLLKTPTASTPLSLDELVKPDVAKKGWSLFRKRKMGNDQASSSRQ
jgi:hypothetical protein